MQKCQICNTRDAQPGSQYCWPCRGVLFENLVLESKAHEEAERKRKARSNYEGLLAVTTKTVLGVKQF